MCNFSKYSEKFCVLTDSELINELMDYNNPEKTELYKYFKEVKFIFIFQNTLKAKIVSL